MGHLPARAQELDHRHHAGGGMARGRPAGAGVGGGGGGGRRGAADGLRRPRPQGRAGVAAAAGAAGVLPTVFIDRGIRDGRWVDRNVGAKRPRLIVLTFIIASVAVGLVLMVALGAPTELSGYFGCMLGSIAVLAAITTVWKISIHCAVASGSVTILTLLFGPWLIPAYLLVALTGWSRVALKDHSAAQVIAGSVLGGVAGGGP